MSAPRLSHRVKLVTSLLAILLLTSCGARTGPETTAIDWWKAFTGADRGKLATLTCDEKRDRLESAMNELAFWTEAFPSVLGSALGIGELSANVAGEGLEATVQTSTRDRAEVIVSGRLRSTVMGVSSVQPFSYPMVLVRENGHWAVCDDLIETVVAQALLGSGASAAGARGRATLTVEEAVRATVEAAASANARATEAAVVAARPTALPSPTPLDKEAFARQVEQGLARATVAADIALRGVAPERDPEVELGQASQVVLSPDGRHAVAAFGMRASSRYVIFDTDSGRIVKRFEIPNLEVSSAIDAAAFSPDGRSLALIGVGDGAAAVGLLRTSDWQPVQLLQSTLRDLAGVRFVAGSQALLAWSSNGVQRLIESWDLESGHVQATVDFSQANDLAISADGSRILLITGVGGERAYEVVEMPGGNRWSCSRALPYDRVQLTEDGRRLIVLAGDSRLVTLDLTSPACTQSDRNLDSFGPNLKVFGFKAERGQLALHARTSDRSTNRGDGFVVLIDDSPLHLLRHPSFAASSGGPVDFAFLPDGKLLLVLSDNRSATVPPGYRVTLWDTQTGEALGELSLPAESMGLAANKMQLSANGRVLAAGYRTLRFYRIDQWLAALGVRQ